MKRSNFNKTLATSIGVLSLTKGLGHLLDIKPENKLGIALVGLGNYATNQLAPALLETKKCELKGIVTGSPEKVEKWKKIYNLRDNQVYNYQNFDTIGNNDEIDIVYIVLPNNMHKEFTLRSFAARKHVICEKPLTTTLEEAKELQALQKKHNSIFAVTYTYTGYPMVREMKEMIAKGVIGDVHKVDLQYYQGWINPVTVSYTHLTLPTNREV